MTSDNMNHTTHRIRPFHIEPGTDGVDETYDIVCGDVGITVAAFHYWEAEAESKRLARQLTAALNAFYRNGGQLRLTGFLAAHRHLHAKYCEPIVHGANDATESNQLKEGESLRAELLTDPGVMNRKRADWAGVAIAAFRQTTGTDYEDVLGDLLADLMHWADHNNFDFEAAFTRGRDQYVAEIHGVLP